MPEDTGQTVVNIATANIALPPGPQIKDFAGICEDPDWILQNYFRALLVWKEVCIAITERFPKTHSGQ